MLEYDLIVCGAGPAGTMAAATAAQAGLKVALLEKRFLPRHKPCGGGTPMVMQSVLRDLAPEAVIESDVLYMRHTWNFADPYLAAINPPGSDHRLSIWMMQRPVFDNTLAQRAVQFGAELRDGLAVRSVTLDGDRVRVEAQAIRESGELAKRQTFVAIARHVIGADGANGVTAKAANLQLRRSIALALEVEHPHQWGSGHVDLRPDVAHLEYGAVPRGYAWIFPKSDHLNIGAGVFRPRKGDTRADKQIRVELQRAIFAYMDALHIPYDADKMKFFGHPLPLWNGKQPLNTPDGRILLAGDAACLINPLFGDGILHAVKSGIVAATCVAEGTTVQYSDRIQTEFAANFDAALLLSRFFYRFPHLCYQHGVKNPRATRIATQLLSGEKSFDHLAGRAIRRIVSRSVRAIFPMSGAASS